jgi:hypothetical protein
MIIWDGIRHLMGWDDPNSFGYLFHSGSGATLEIVIWGSLLWFWRTSCDDRRWCLRHGRHPITDPESGVTHKVCWKHAGLPTKYGIGRIHAIQAKNRLLYLGKKPGRG